MSHLAWNRYGKSGIRLVKVRRPAGGEPHDIVDLTVDVQIEGAFEPVYVKGDNSGCLPTDTMKNTVYAFARRDPIDHIESFGLRLTDHLAGKPHVSRVRVAAAEHQLDFASGAIKDGVEELVDAMLFVDEAPLTSTVTGTSGFAEIFAAEGPRDRAGRSFRQLDLDHRLLRYPCSYMIYSPAFRALPAELRDAVFHRAWTVLSGRDPRPKYSRMAETDRRAVMDILRDTVPDLPADR